MRTTNDHRTIHLSPTKTKCTKCRSETSKSIYQFGTLKWKAGINASHLCASVD